MRSGLHLKLIALLCLLPWFAHAQPIWGAGQGPNVTYATGTLAYTNGGTGLTSLGAASSCLQVNVAGTALTYSSCGAGTVGSGSAGQIPYYAADGSTLTATGAITIGTTGLVGLGTTIPTSQLTVVGNSKLTGTELVTSTSANALTIGTSGSTTIYGLNVDNSTAGANTGWNDISTVTPNGAFLKVASPATNENGFLVAKGNGAIILRNASTTGGLTQPQVICNNTDGTSSDSCVLAFEHNGAFIGYLAAISEGTNTLTGHMVLYGDNVGSTTAGVEVDHSGNVGIGTTTAGVFNSALAVNGLITSYGGTPTCGTGCSSISANSTNTRGSANGNTSVTSIVVNWSTTLSSAPFCTIGQSSTGAAIGFSTSTTAITFSLASALSADVVTWQCMQ